MWETALTKSPSEPAPPSRESWPKHVAPWLRSRAAHERRIVELVRQVEDLQEELASTVASLEAKLTESRDKLRDFAETRNQLKYHQDTLRRTRARLSGPSFHRELQSLKNYGFAMAELDPESVHPLRQIQYKLRTYRFAASHGVAVPDILGSWMRLSDIRLSELPEAFVLKSDGGAASEGVLPLRRADPERYVTVDGTRELTETEVLRVFEEAASAGRSWGAYFAEEFLEQPGGGPIPDDVKIYVAYGRVLQVLLRRVTEHGREASVAYKYVTAAGEDLGRVTSTRNIDSSIPVPGALPEMVSIAKHLSRAVGVPFCRVDLYDTTHGIVLGEITRTPGGPQTYELDHDRAMGELFLLAQAELELDVLRGRPLAMLHGRQLAPNHYPSGHPAREQPDAPLWRMHVLPCDAWCY